ncbi:hypothetical protein BC831DRAFT_443428 [Entophlyctis helioformis]|nr:hypothetical protein BC831DRAFT_443428 [Entophlyctis helioformis]
MLDSPSAFLLADADIYAAAVQTPLPCSPLHAASCIASVPIMTFDSWPDDSCHAASLGIESVNNASQHCVARQPSGSHMDAIATHAIVVDQDAHTTGIIVSDTATASHTDNSARPTHQRRKIPACLDVRLHNTVRETSFQQLFDGLYDSTTALPCFPPAVPKTAASSKHANCIQNAMTILETPPGLTLAQLDIPQVLWQAIEQYEADQTTSPPPAMIDSLPDRCHPPADNAAKAESAQMPDTVSDAKQTKKRRYKYMKKSLRAKAKKLEEEQKMAASIRSELAALMEQTDSDSGNMPAQPDMVPEPGMCTEHAILDACVNAVAGSPMLAMDEPRAYHLDGSDDNVQNGTLVASDGSNTPASIDVQHQQVQPAISVAVERSIATSPGHTHLGATESCISSFFTITSTLAELSRFQRMGRFLDMLINDMALAFSACPGGRNGSRSNQPFKIVAYPGGENSVCRSECKAVIQEADLLFFEDKHTHRPYQPSSILLQVLTSPPQQQPYDLMPTFNDWAKVWFDTSKSSQPAKPLAHSTHVVLVDAALGGLVMQHAFDRQSPFQTDATLSLSGSPHAQLIVAKYVAQLERPFAEYISRYDIGSLDWHSEGCGFPTNGSVLTMAARGLYDLVVRIAQSSPLSVAQQCDAALFAPKQPQSGQLSPTSVEFGDDYRVGCPESTLFREPPPF